MRTVKDILRILSEQLGSNELSALAGASNLNEAEIEEENFTKLKEQISSLMDIEAAVANNSVIDRIFEENKSRVANQALYSVEKRLSEFGKKVGIDLKGKEKAHDMLDVMTKDLEAKIASSGSDEELKKLVESLKKDKEDLSSQLSNSKEEFEKQLKEKETEFNSKTIRKEFDLQMKSLPWADAYRNEKVNKALIDSIYNEIDRKATLKVIDGNLVPFQKELPEKEYYQGNKKASFQELIALEVQEYLKKSEPEPKRDINGKTERKEFKDLSQAERRKLAMKQTHD